MTPALKSLIERITCPACLGNGMFGGREVATFDSAGRPATYRNLPRVCEECGGNGIKISPQHPPAP